jgi:hypothetical protein
MIMMMTTTTTTTTTTTIIMIIIRHRETVDTSEARDPKAGRQAGCRRKADIDDPSNEAVCSNKAGSHSVRCALLQFWGRAPFEHSRYLQMLISAVPNVVLPKSCGETWTRGVFTFTGVGLVRALYMVFVILTVGCSSRYCGGCSYWSVTTYILVDVCRRIGITCCCRLQDVTVFCSPAGDTPLLWKVAKFVQETTASYLFMSVITFTVPLARK